MKTCSELIEQWNKCKGKGQILVDHNHPLRLYLNVNTRGNKELLVPIEASENRFSSTLVIGINNYHNDNKRYLAIELLDSEYQDEYYSLCFDLIESSREAENEKQSRTQLFATFRKWYQLFTEVSSGILPEREIKGLIGELSFIKDEIEKNVNPFVVINAWCVHKDSSRDFIFDDDWAEIKTIDNSKEYITISSIEQLDHDMRGSIVVYKVKRTKEQKAISLISLISLIKGMIDSKTDALFSYKLLSKGYTYAEEYLEFCYQMVSKDVYIIKEGFPRLRRKNLPQAIRAAKYDLQLDSIEEWRV